MIATAKDVQKVIEDEDDFGHEMRVGAVFANSKLDLGPVFVTKSSEHGGTYIDPIQNKPRQFDYRFAIRRDVDQSGKNEDSQTIHLAVECKNLHASSPLAVCCLPRTTEEGFHNTLKSDAPFQCMSFTTLKVEGQSGLGIYSARVPVGKALVRLKAQEKNNAVVGWKVDSQGDVYDRWAQAVQSASAKAQQIRSRNSSAQKVEKFVFLPVVVVPDDTLWKVEYGQNSKISKAPEKVDSCEYYIGRTIEHSNGKPIAVLTHIHFLTLKGFTQMLERYLRRNQNGGDWGKLFPTFESQMIF